MLSEKSQSQKATYSMILFIGKAHNRQTHRDRKHINGCLGLEWGGSRRLGSVSYGVWNFFQGNENGSKSIVMMVAQICEYAKSH